MYVFFFSSRRRHTRCGRDWSSDVCSSDLDGADDGDVLPPVLVVVVRRTGADERRDRDRRLPWMLAGALDRPGRAVVDADVAVLDLCAGVRAVALVDLDAGAADPETLAGDRVGGLEVNIEVLVAHCHAALVQVDLEWPLTVRQGRGNRFTDVDVARVE